MIKWIAISIFGLLILFDVLLIMGSAELERRHNEDIKKMQRESYQKGYTQGYEDGRTAR